MSAEMLSAAAQLYEKSHLKRSMKVIGIAAIRKALSLPISSLSSSVSIFCCFITFCVSRRRRKMYCGHARLCVCLSVCMSVCLSAAACPHYCTDPDVTWGSGRGCPLVVHYWADFQSVHGLRCYGNVTRTLVTSLRPSRDMTT